MSVIAKVSWGGSGFASSYLSHNTAKKILNDLEKNSWLGYVMPSGVKKVAAVGAAVVATGATSIAASFVSPENKKYVWAGGILSLIILLAQETMGSGSGGSIGNSSEGVRDGSGEGQSTTRTDREIIDSADNFQSQSTPQQELIDSHNLPNPETMQELERMGVVDAIVENNDTLKVTVGENTIYSPIGSAYVVDSSTEVIFLDEVLFLIANAKEIKTVEVRRSFGDQGVIDSKVNQIINQAERYGKTAILHDKPFITWGTVNAS